MSNVQRILRNTSPTLEVTFYVNGTPTDPTGNVATVTITKADGTAIVTNAATTRQSTGVYRYTLATQANLNFLTVKWTGTFSGSSQIATTYAEIVGGHLFTEAQARAFDGAALVDETKYPDAELARARNRVTDRLEQMTGISWIPRFARITVDGDGTNFLDVPHSDLIAVTSVKIDGTALDAAALADIDIRNEEGGIKRKTLGTFPSGDHNIVVEYEYGKLTLEDGVDRIALIAIRQSLFPSVIADRATSFTDGDTTFRLTYPGRKHPFGLPEVDEWVFSHSRPVLA